MISADLSNLIVENKDVSLLNWWRVGGHAKYFSAPTTEDDLKKVWHWAWKNKISFWVVSGGSNVLFQDGLIDGLVLSIHELKGIKSPPVGGEAAVVTCWAGTSKSEIAKIFLQNRLPPAVFLTGIPGDMGAGVVMNAGIGESRIPREFCEIVDSIEVLRIHEETGEFYSEQIKGRNLVWEYRHCNGWQPGIITTVTVSWPYLPDVQVPEDVRAQTKKRISSQPLNLPNCGSVFRNPAGHKSAVLIESCQLKGFRIGGACVSQKHANFIVNDQGATSHDIHQIIKHVQTTVKEKTGVVLQTEIVYIGDWGGEIK